MPDPSAWSQDAHRFLDGEGPPPADPVERDRAALFEQAVRDWTHGLPSLDERIDAGVMAALRGRALLRADTWWRWLLEPRRVALRPALALAASMVLVALSSAVTVVLRDRPAVAPGAGTSGPVMTGTVLVRFELVAPLAHRVTLAGSFNAWSDSTISFARSSTTGAWTVTVPLPPGEHQYLFVIDGERWVPDPAAHAQVQDEFGQTNSVLVVGPRGVVRS